MSTHSIVHLRGSYSVSVSRAKAMSCVQASSDRDWTSNSLSGPNTLQESTVYGCQHRRLTDSCSTELSRNQIQYYPRPSPHRNLPSKRLRKMPKSSTLSVTLSHPFVADDGPRSPRSPKLPISANRESFVLRDTMDRTNAFGNNFSAFSASGLSLSRDPPGRNELPKSPAFTSLPPHLTSPKSTTSYAREPSHSFFANVQASKSSSRIEPADLTIRHVTEEPPSAQTQSEEDSIYSLRPTPGSTPDLSTSNLISSEAGQSGGTFSTLYCKFTFSRSYTHCYVQIALIRLPALHAHQSETSLCRTACYLKTLLAIYRQKGVSPDFLVC